MSTSISLEEEDYLELPSGLSHEEASRRIHHNYLLYKSQLDRFKVEAKPNIEYASSKSNAKPLWKIILRDNNVNIVCGACMPISVQSHGTG